jgi:outer membrane protein with beta-barrel domain
MRKATLVLLVLFGLAAPAFAQDEKPYDVNIGGGALFPIGSYKDSFDTGGSFVIGGTYFFTPVLGIQGEYNYGRMNGPQKTIFVSSTPGGLNPTSQLLESNQQQHALLFDLVARSHNRDSVVGGYVVGGMGYYHRIVQITSPAVGFTTFCDPYWYVCYPAAVSVDNILGDRSSNDFGINFGGGITFGHEAKFYVEARYHYVWGPAIANASNLPSSSSSSAPSNANASYFPLIFGVRF